MDTAHILVVDDEEAILEVVSTMLESRGYKCTALSNGRAAQEFIRKQAPDLILLDLILPEMTASSCSIGSAVSTEKSPS